MPPIPNLTSELWLLANQVPTGNVTTYGHVARALGDVSASRFVGEVLLHHSHDAKCICHRFVRADGSLGKYTSGNVDDKAHLLRNEGHAIDTRRDGALAVALGPRFSAFESTAPLKQLAQFQASIAAKAVTAETIVDSRTIAGVDVSFVPNSRLAVAAYVEVCLKTRRPTYVETHRDFVPFPYISGYLAFRELPLIISLIEKVRETRSLADVIIVDGSGVLHPRGAGVATMLGVATETTTIGITKKRLAGRGDLGTLEGNAFREIQVGDFLRGFAILPRSDLKKPIYISPGHRCDPVSTLAIVQRCRLGRRLPEPIYWADRLSRKEARSTEN